MKKLLFFVSILASMSVFGSSKLFDYDLWAKDLQTMIKLNSVDNSTVEGADKNHNQVRDDVENYVKQKYAHDEFQKVMFLEAARKIQQILTLPKDTSKSVRRQLDKQLLQIYTCRDYILFKHDDIDLEKELEAKNEFKSKVLNTKKRLNIYIKHKKMLPFEYSIPSDEELVQQRVSCERLYSKIKSESKKGVRITAK